MTLEWKTAVAALSLAVGVSCVAGGALAAKKKLSYEEAFAQCKKEIAVVHTKDNDPARYTAGSGCMKKYGYKLKKGTEM